MQNLSNSTAGLRDLILVCTSCVCFSKPVLPKNYSKHFQPKRLQNDAMWVQPMWKRKDQCLKSSKKNSFNIWFNFWFLCALQLTFWTLLKGRITFQIQPSGWTWTMQVFWKRIGANESPHSSTLKRVLAFLCLAITGSQTKPICICKFLELDPPRSLLTELGNRINRENTDGPKLHIIQSERPKSRLCVCYACTSRRSSCQGMWLSLKPPNNPTTKTWAFVLACQCCTVLVNLPCAKSFC